jgi:deferrochelatase/peroxidase EfeB
VRGWYGATQPGIAERTRSSSLLAAFTCVAADRDALDQMFRDLGAGAQRLCDGVSEGPTDNPELPSPTTGILGAGSTKGTSVTVSVGASLFDDRYGLADRKPTELVRMPFLANDRLEDRWSHGDVLIQVAADRPDALAHALRQLMRATRASLMCTG